MQIPNSGYSYLTGTQLISLKLQTEMVFRKKNKKETCSNSTSVLKVFVDQGMQVPQITACSPWPALCKPPGCRLPSDVVPKPSTVQSRLWGSQAEVWSRSVLLLVATFT